jgi:hypothetical protein
MNDLELEIAQKINGECKVCKSKVGLTKMSSPKTG